ncbi:hypothetical protein LOTGIDRAFT_236294 [Lottia gigantea]|uniref:RING-type domain-containing protein n=1 Tax=Lottia gigantea TaxID=225164 RepID=V4B6Y7_LOTGI|nr:hypothetical protein LOTGIDRAFT_236294 [Lottia gigantea]ESO84319.1 hypothetical protein LOTGIDRAFT_236294 [Lottia gigantea]
MAITPETRRSFVTDVNHWSRELICNVCLEYFTNPHTLHCGHSFCLCCVKRLALTARDFNCTSKLSKIKFRCPTCRYGTSVEPIIKQSVPVSYGLRDVVEGWKREKKQFCDENGVTDLRSIGTQTPSVYDATEVSEPDTFERLYPGVAYIKKAMDVTESDDSSNDGATVMPKSSTSVETNSSSHNPESESEWENFNNLDQPEADQDQPEAAQENADNGLEILWSPGRVALTVFWFIYTITVSVVANGFLPYMLLYTLMFVLILYTETVQRNTL